MTILILVLLGLVGALCAAFALPLARYIERHPEVLVAAVFLVYLYSATMTEGASLAVSLGGMNVFPLDLLCPLMLLFAFPFYYGKLKYGFSKQDIELLILLAWAMVLGWNFLAGCREFGLQAATNGFRGYLYVICIAIYTASLSVSDVWPKVEKLIFAAAAGLVLIALAGYSDGDLSRAGRPLSSNETMVLLEAFVVAAVAFAAGRLKPFYFMVSLSLLPMILLLQHRSVWVVTACAIFGLYWTLPALRSLLLKILLIGGIVGTVAAFAFTGDAIFKALDESTEEAFSDESTMSWRYVGWLSLLTGEQMDSVKEVAIGNSFGSGWGRTFKGSDGRTIEIENVKPHNYYIQTLLRGGVVGLGLLLVMYCRFLRLRRADMPANPVYSSASKALFVTALCQLVYYLPYDADTAQAVFLGLAISAVRQSRMQWQAEVNRISAPEPSALHKGSTRLQTT
ncbi:O-antigen ligase family protein [Coraliomargarita parva]|uniref:O-antigen ligase family protein n=1 Tax=Coraliomargarita parva TaxID=3014050 RepID=UPI0022B36619|nr:O-antigen ligase family protein [Coraliomargarita parva]